MQISANLEITVTMADVVVRFRGISSPNKTTTTTPFLMQYLCCEMEKGKWRRKENLEVSITTIRDHEVSTSCDMPWLWKKRFFCKVIMKTWIGSKKKFPFSSSLFWYETKATWHGYSMAWPVTRDDICAEFGLRFWKWRIKHIREKEVRTA